MIKAWMLSRPPEQQRPPIIPPPCAPRVRMEEKNLRSLCLILSILLYLLIGAAVFDALESDSERAKTEALEEALEELKRRHGFSEGEYREVERAVLQAAPHRAGTHWKFAGSFYFAITVITTIGKCACTRLSPSTSLHSAPRANQLVFKLLVWGGKCTCSCTTFLFTLNRLFMISITKIDLVVAGGVRTPSEQCQGTLEQGTKALVARF